MTLAGFLIGFREGLEAALVIGILLAYATKLQRHDVKRKIWYGVAAAVLASLAAGAFFTFGRAQLTFFQQELIGGTMSLLAVAMITWMVFWMLKTGSRLRAELEQGMNRALLLGSGTAIFWLAFVTVAREGLETTILLWGWINSAVALGAAVAGIIVATGFGILINRGAVRANLRAFFTWTGAFLLLVSAGVLAYGIHDLQEAAILPGPFSGHPITPTNFRTGDVLTGFEGPFWGAAFPFGWAFNVEHVIAPGTPLAALLQGTIGFVPQMSWLAVLAWALYLRVTIPAFVRISRRKTKFSASSGQITKASSGQITKGENHEETHQGCEHSGHHRGGGAAAERLR